ncbi:hypothetical protein [Bacillus sp. FJAT-27245]|uniref:hypothetical protein n=1 Tax=Bacillus sp. FJAT-27245 TaxID=1684144 RepID=UPI0006A7D7F4|nr:hypothetical protein [Bacillus sp. FJAT-27245]
MKITDYYFQTSKASLNSSIVFLFPALLLIAFNILFIKNNQAMLLCLPFITGSMVYFHIHLANYKRAACSALDFSVYPGHLLKVNHILVFYEAKLNPGLILFSSNGIKIGELRRVSPGIPFYRKKVELLDCQSSLIARYVITQKCILVYDLAGRLIGSLCKNRSGWAMAVEGKTIATIDSSRVFMDVKIIGVKFGQAGRLRRGMMPMEWKAYAADPNTPVFTLHSSLTDEERLLFMCVLVKEFFVER